MTKQPVQVMNHLDGLPFYGVFTEGKNAGRKHGGRARTRYPENTLDRRLEHVIPFLHELHYNARKEAPAMSQIMPYAIIVFIILLVADLAKRRSKPTAKPEAEPETPMTPEDTSPTLAIRGAYQKKWLFSYNEKDAYKKLKPIADELGLTIFAKVRLLDLLEPKKGIEKYKTYFYKVQAKHVDFVLCDEKLVARYVIELDDSSHDTDERQQRDRFVDEVLNSVGYKIIHTREITDAIKDELIKNPSESGK